MHGFEILLSHKVESRWTMTLGIHILTRHVTLLDQRGTITHCGCLIVPNVGIRLYNGAPDLGTGLLGLVPTGMVFTLPENKIIKLYSNLTFNFVIVIRQIEQIGGFSKNLVQKQSMTTQLLLLT